MESFIILDELYIYLKERRVIFELLNLILPYSITVKMVLQFLMSIYIIDTYKHYWYILIAQNCCKYDCRVSIKCAPDREINSIRTKRKAYSKVGYSHICLNKDNFSQYKWSRKDGNISWRFIRVSQRPISDYQD